MVEKRKFTPAEVDEVIQANLPRLQKSYEAGKKAVAEGRPRRSFDEPGLRLTQPEPPKKA